MINFFNCIANRKRCQDIFYHPASWYLIFIVEQQDKWELQPDPGQGNILDIGVEFGSCFYD